MLPRSLLRAALQPHLRRAPARAFWGSRDPAAFSDPNRDAAKAERLITSLTNPTATHPDILAAAELAERAVRDASSPRAKTLLASLHREGFGVDKDLARAEQLFLEASEAGDPIAQCSLGVMQLASLKPSSNEGAGASTENLDVAVAVNEKGEYVGARINNNPETDQGDTDADTDADKSAESDAQQKGSDVPAQLVRKVRKERRAAGFSDHQAREFEDYKERKAEEQADDARRSAHTWLQRAIDQGNDTAMVALANDILHSDAARAAQLFERAAKDHRNIIAYYTLGQLYERGLPGVPTDLSASFRCFSMAAQLGDPAAQLYMGSLYHRGSFVVDTDPALALRYVEMAAEQRHSAALHYLALMHRNGECGLTADETKFRDLIFQAAKSGEYAPALYTLADMYYGGSDGVDVDYVKAIDLYTRAGKAGENEALCSAAAMHFHGTGVPKDERKAFELYQDAAVKGSVNALRNIASMHFYGHGVPTNKKISKHFMKVADEMEKEKKKESSAAMDRDERQASITEAPVGKLKGFVPRGKRIPTLAEMKEAKAAKSDS